MEEKNELQQETEAVKAVREELSAQIQELKNNYENTINTMRTEHSNQLRDILRNGNSAANAQALAEMEKEEDIDEDGISRKALRAQIDIINKNLQRY